MIEATKTEEIMVYWKAYVDLASRLMLSSQVDGRYEVYPVNVLLQAKVLERFQTGTHLSAVMLAKILTQCPAGEEAAKLWWASLVLNEESQIRKMVLKLIDAPYGYRVYAIGDEVENGEDEDYIEEVMGQKWNHFIVSQECECSVYAWHFDDVEDAAAAERKFSKWHITAEAAPAIKQWDVSRFPAKDLQTDMEVWLMSHQEEVW